MTRQEKLEFMDILNWDYNETPENMLSVIEGKKTDCVFTREDLFVRSLERISWHYLINLWGVEQCKELYTPDIAKRIRSKELRRSYDYAFSILQGNPLPPAEWGSEHCQKIKRAFLSSRWNRPELE